MLRHYITFAFRNLLRNKFHSLINILGLAIGVSACLVIYLIVSYELSFNTNIPDFDRIYRVHDWPVRKNETYLHGACTGIVPFMKDNFKDIGNVSLFFTYEAKVQICESSTPKELGHQNRIAIADEDYFKTFKFYQWRAGSPKVLEEAHKVVLTESQAKKYFGNIPIGQMIGKRVTYGDSLETTLAGIIADVNICTDFDFTDFISLSTLKTTWLKNEPGFKLDDWNATSSISQVFVKMEAGTSQQQLIEQLPLLSKASKEKNIEWAKEFNAQPLSDLHFNAETEIFDHSRPPAQHTTLLALSVVAVLLLVIGAINFINLETALAVRRAKEIGIRKVLGSTRERLVFQFLSESLVITFISVLVALPVAELGLIFFSEFIPSGVVLSLRKLIPILILIVFFIGLLASAYPAFVLSSFQPALALKNQAYAGVAQSRTAFLRQLLIVIQFTFAQALILGTLVVGWQVHYLLTKDLGFKKDAVIYLYTPSSEDYTKNKLLKTELETIPEIQKLSMSDEPAASTMWYSMEMEYKGLRIHPKEKFVDTAYLRFYNIKVLAGRNLLPSDTLKEIIINETLLKQLGFFKPQDAIDKVVSFRRRKIPIVGVVKDFHFQSLHQVIEPIAMSAIGMNNQRDFTCINIQLVSANSGKTMNVSLQKIEKAWKKIYPNTPFTYSFLDETLRTFYETDQRTAKLTGTAMGLAIFISCLGLFGLVSYTVVQRTKEVGIRKVMGASVQQIVLLLSKDFLALVIISFVFASPIAWYVINQWLQNFPYRVELGVWTFAITGMIAIAVAFATLSYQTFRTANANPVESLRSE